MSGAEPRWSTSSNHSDTTKFPDFEPAATSREHSIIYEESADRPNLDNRGSSPHNYTRTNGALHSERWHSRKDNAALWGLGHGNGSNPRHGRQKSLSDAFKTIRAKKGSMTANAHEIAEALKAPVSWKLVSLCLIWYMSSALTNTSSKSILNAFPKPITLTLIQFAFVSFWCILLVYLARLHPSLGNAIPALRHGIRYPTREVVGTTLPLALFQLSGHILSSTAMAKIPVSLVHTIKGLSPLFTVLAYRLVFNIHHSTYTYLSLIPLTGGVILACSVEFSGNLVGILCAFIAALIFVTQNIFSKRLFDEAARAEGDGVGARNRKLDKLNMLCYCSGLAFILTTPIWIWLEGWDLFKDFYTDGSIALSNKPSALDHGALTLEFVFNGVFHFGQNIIAFVLLSMVSPVTYSVASLIKRVFVIVVAIVWFGSQTTPVQAAGIALTFLGLYLYDRTSDAARADRRANLTLAKNEPSLLPTAYSRSQRTPSISLIGSPVANGPVTLFAGSNGYGPGSSDHRDDALGQPSGNRQDTWLPPGTRQEETWRPRDMGVTT